ncbi:relaxase/mobilization nuclease domain-containing protein [Frondihabitans australicus]|uniref:Relaxase/mobilization nuclease-like protein n=1 Tax=Frondihabitans australicus TaxID=386892 RepID=A0A495IFH8_9MICO|nr:relaxase/mobilization nuclease domain-containing protein [Frondihabitans australicus]RKR74757.1 relaxase/mobilization nuclease-like protein [Frondihabitans australicus]
MSVTDVKPDYDLKASTDYLVLGKDAKRKTHLADGTNRLVPGFYCDAPDIASFVALGDELATRHGRKIKAQSYVLSFSPQELSVDNDADLQRVGDVAFLLAKKMHPHSPCLIVVHADGKGHAPHAHVKVLNHNMVTGKALTDHRMHWQVKQANDELMREVRHDVLDVQPKFAAPEWSRQRSEMTPFEVELGDRVAAARDEAGNATHAEGLFEPEAFMTAFEVACQQRGVRVEVSEHRIRHGGRGSRLAGDSVTGFTFAMRDESMPVPRWKRRKASSLSQDFTRDRLLLLLLDEKRLSSLQEDKRAIPTVRVAAVDRSEWELEAAAEETPTAAATVLSKALPETPVAPSFADRMRAALDEADLVAQTRSAEAISEYLSAKPARVSEANAELQPSTTTVDEPEVAEPHQQGPQPVLAAVPEPWGDSGSHLDVAPPIGSESVVAPVSLVGDEASADVDESQLADSRAVDDSSGPSDRIAPALATADHARQRRLARIRAELAADDADRDATHDGPSLT